MLMYRVEKSTRKQDNARFCSLQLGVYYHVVCVSIDGVWIDDHLQVVTSTNYSILLLAQFIVY
jgi:hypothetical protein